MRTEEKLQRQSAIARSQYRGKRTKEATIESDTNATVINYNADLGQSVIQLPDGSISYAASDTNGALAIGETVPRNAGTGNIDNLGNKPTFLAATSPPSRSFMTSIAILFYTQKTLSPTKKEYTFYVGGIFKTPLKVTSIIQDIEAPNGYVLANLYAAASISNSSQLIVEFLLFFPAGRFPDTPGTTDSFDVEHDLYVLNVNSKTWRNIHFEESFANEYTPSILTNLSILNSTNRCIEQFVRLSEIPSEFVILRLASIYKNRVFVVQNFVLDNIKTQETTEVDLSTYIIIDRVESCQTVEAKTYKRIKCFGLSKNLEENKIVLAVIGWVR